jgi:hypothetical protein
VKPVALLRMVIGASLMTAPDGSVTIPEIVPTGACAQRTGAINTLSRTPSATWGNDDFDDSFRERE